MNSLTTDLIHNLNFAVLWELNFSLNQIQVADRAPLLINKQADRDGKSTEQKSHCVREMIKRWGSDGL